MALGGEAVAAAAAAPAAGRERCRLMKIKRRREGEPLNPIVVINVMIKGEEVSG